MNYPELMSELARRLQLSTAAPGASGHCALRFDDVVVHFTHVPGAKALDLYAALGHVDLRDPAAQESLRLAREHTSLLHCEPTGELSLRQRFHLQAMAFPPFFKALERFINLADHWRLQFASARGPR